MALTLLEIPGAFCFEKEQKLEMDELLGTIT